MELRRATGADVPDIVGLVNAISAVSPASVAEAPEHVEVWASVFAQNHESYPWLVAEVDGAFTGFAKASAYGARDGYRWSVEVSVYLVEGARGQGLANALYNRLFEILRAQGFRQAWARITSPNPASEHLHRRFGLTQIGLQTRFAWKQGRWHDISLWQGPLSDDEGAPGPLRSVTEALR